MPPELHASKRDRVRTLETRYVHVDSLPLVFKLNLKTRGRLSTRNNGNAKIIINVLSEVHVDH